MRVEPSGLVAAAQRLRTIAAQLAFSADIHPPLAGDQTSAAAAARLTAASAQLGAAIGVQAGALAAVADHLVAVAARFAGQESLNADAVGSLASTQQPVTAFDALAPPPPLPTDVRAPLPPPVATDGETVSQQLNAGSSSAGSAFAQAWRHRATVAASSATTIREVVTTLPELWDGPAGTDAAVTRLMHHAGQLSATADRAAGLADQADGHASAHVRAVTNAPRPEAFEAVRVQLQQALAANAQFPGRYTALVSSLITKQGAMQQQALNAQGQYHDETEATTDPAKQGGQQHSQDASQLAAAAPSLLPSLIPAALGAIGGAAGGAVGAAMQLPQALMQTGQQLAQAATQSLSGLMQPGVADPRLTTAAGHRPDLPAGGAGSGGGATHPAGAGDRPLVAPATSPAPPVTNPVPQGAAAQAAAPASSSTFTAMPMGMPLGMTQQPAGDDATKPTPADKKLVLPTIPHTESVTGKAIPERLAATAGPPVAEPRSASRRITLRMLEDER